MRKTLIILGALLTAQVFLVGSLLAAHPLDIRITLFARASVAEAMRMRANLPTSADSQAGVKMISQLEQQLTGIENKVDIFIDLSKNKKREAIQQFRRALMEKCCRLAGGTGGGGGGGGGQGKGGGGGGGGGKRRGLGKGGG